MGQHASRFKPPACRNGWRSLRLTGREIHMTGYRILSGAGADRDFARNAMTLRGIAG
jgi:hypothetical protein